MSNEIPTIKLGDICATTKPGLSSYYFKKREEEGTKLSVVNIKDVREGYIDSSDIDCVDVHLTSGIEKSKIKTGDIIISTKGSNLRAAVADKNIEGFVFSANLTVLTLKHAIDPEIVVSYLNSSYGQQELNKRAGGSTFRTLNTKQLLEVAVPMPPLEKQQELGRLLKDIREYTQSLTEEASKWTQIAEETVIRTLELR